VSPPPITALLAPLQALPDPQARLMWVFNRARGYPPAAPALRCDDYRVPGCLVGVWWHAGFDQGRCQFHSDSEALSLKALVGLLCELYHDRTPVEILAFPPNFLDRLGLLRQVTESRRATVLRVAEQIQSFAANCPTRDASA
jgi:sulfur transfer protein SufE